MPLAKILCQCRFHKEIDQGAFIEKFLRDESFHRGMKFTISFRKLLVGLRGLEPPTSRLSGVRSNHLSYKPMLVSASGRRFRLPTPCGGDEEDRTPDPLLARQVLSQLSYTPIFQPFD